jgi:ABC-type lipoprotein export system ATPase subunit
MRRHEQEETMIQLQEPSEYQVTLPSAARAEGLTKFYRRGAEEVRALDGVNLTLARGEFAAVVGASGSGKSTLMNLLGCMDTPTSGRLWIAGKEVAGLTDADLTRIRRRHLGFIFQQFHLLPTLTVLENVLLPATLGSGESDVSPQKREGSEGRETDEQQSESPPVSPGLSRFRSLRVFAAKEPRAPFALSRQGAGTRAARLERARVLLARVGLGKRLNHLPSQLSGGEMQRVAVARSLINEPELLLADEPTGNLDTEASRIVLEILRDLNADGLTIVLVTHNPELAAQTRRVIRLRDGRIVEDARV